MAKKGNANSNGFERNSSGDCVASSESPGTPLKKGPSRPETSTTPETSGRDKDSIDNSDCSGQPNNSSRKKSLKNAGLEHGKKSAGHRDMKITKGKSATFGGSGTKVTSSMSKEASNSMESACQDSARDVDERIFGEAKEHVDRMTNAENSNWESPNTIQDSSMSYSGLQHHVENETNDNSQHVDGNENDKNRVSLAFVWFKQASEWIQKQKPLLIELSAVARQAKDSVVSRVQHSWPIVYKWILYLGKLSLLFLILWMDYSLRGLGSLLRLGTTAFFVVFWCSFLSTIAMAGFLTVLLSVGAVSIVAFFLGYTAAISIIAIFGIVVLWMHGSFWMTSSLMIVAGLIFALSREHLALLITIVYSMYCAKCHVGWLGIILCMNLAFISSDILIYFMKSSANGSMGQGFDEEARGTKGATRNFATGSGYYGPSGEQGNFTTQRSFGESSQTVESEDSHGRPSNSGLSGVDQTSAEEVIRLLDSSDHYAALGFSRYDNIDVAVLKREYRKKAMLVHPDKNIGDVKAEEAFKKLQNAYEVLLDSVKRKVYDDELRREELISCFRRFQSGTQRNSRYGSFKHVYTNSEDKERDYPADSRRITCKKCNDSHVWIQTERTKARARWCQECQDYHQARDGDGWVEQSSHAFLFGMLRKVDTPRAYACVESKIYDATEWLICQGMVCPPNTHKPTFHVNTTIVGKNTTRGGGSNHKTGNNGGIPTNLDENMTEEEFFEWLQNAMASGIFDTGNISPENAGMKTGNNAKNNKKKKKGKKQW